MGLKYSTISASVRFLGVFAKHCYDQRSWSVQGGAKHILLQIRSMMISENKQSSKILASKTDSILFGLISVLVNFEGIPHIFLALRYFQSRIWRMVSEKLREGQFRLERGASCEAVEGQVAEKWWCSTAAACRGWFTNPFHSAQCDIFMWMTRQSWCMPYNRICQLAFPRKHLIHIVCWYVLIYLPYQHTVTGKVFFVTWRQKHRYQLAGSQVDTIESFRATKSSNSWLGFMRLHFLTIPLEIAEC